jgi:hypothetical protein
MTMIKFDLLVRDEDVSSVFPSEKTAGFASSLLLGNNLSAHSIGTLDE